MGIPGRSGRRLAGRASLILAFLVLAGILASGLLRTHGDVTRTLSNRFDFRAFYCAGSAVLHGRDPYLAEPLRSCEIAETVAAGAQPEELVAVPAPLPSYSLAFFALLARLPIERAAVLYTLLLIASVAITLILLHTMTGYPLLGIFGVLALSDCWVSMAYGQIVPISLMFLCAAAAAAARDRPVVAAFCAAGAMIEPHIALPACAALFLFERRSRAPLAACAALLLSLALLTTGWRTNVEYLSSVLPAHALAESTDIGQFSLTTLLHRVGVDAGLALRLADLSYAVMVTLGIIVARRLHTQTGAREILVLVPPAFALFGGPFLHTSQMAVAVPALLVLIQHFPQRRAPLSTALVIMAIPWLELAENPLPQGLIAVAAATGALSIFVLRTNPLRSATIVLCTTAAAACERYLRTRFPPLHLHLDAELARASSGSSLASATWAIHSRSTLSTHWYIASHVPAWTGLLLMIGAAAVLALARASSDSRLPAAATDP